MPQAQGQQTQRRRLLSGAVSVGVHLALLFAVVSVRPEPPRAVELAPIAVELVQLPPPRIEPPPEPEPAPPSEAPPAETPPPPKPEPPKEPPPKRRIVARVTPTPPPTVIPVPASEGPSSDGLAEVSDAELAGAARAGTGGSGGECDMPRLLQAALRKDRLVQSAVAQAHRGKAIRVWNGDWVRHPGQEGGGLAAVREAIMWEVGFAPKACRSEPVRGLVVISMNEGPGSARLVMGSGHWRWSDLLFTRSAGTPRRPPLP